MAKKSRGLNNKWILLGLGGLALLFMGAKGKSSQLPDTEPGGGNQPVKPPPAPAPSAFPLKQGSKGTEVTTLQNSLIRLGQKITADGSFGPKTAAALAALKYPATIDEATYKKINTAGNNSAWLDYWEQVKSLWQVGAYQDTPVYTVVNVFGYEEKGSYIKTFPKGSVIGNFSRIAEDQEGNVIGVVVHEYPHHNELLLLPTQYLTYKVTGKGMSPYPFEPPK